MTRVERDNCSRHGKLRSLIELPGGGQEAPGKPALLPLANASYSNSSYGISFSIRRLPDMF